MTYARARLWTGISGVGLVVLASALALGLGWPERWLPSGADWSRDIALLALLSALFALVFLPVDVFAGLVLNRLFGVPRGGLARFGIDWLRGVLFQSLIFSASGAALLLAGRSFGLAGALAAFALLMLVLLAAQAPIARLVGGLIPNRSGDAANWGTRRVEVVRAVDPSFTGGIVGWPGAERIVIPERWLEVLGKDGVSALIDRRRLLAARGWRAQGLGLALVWNLVGFSLAAIMPGSGVIDLPGLVTLFLWFNLWSFAGLLVLPRPSRAGVLAADRAAVEAGTPSETLVGLIRKLDRLQDDEPERSEALESIFHPVPAVGRRARALEAPSSGSWAPWNAARTALFLSWAGAGMLARAVHCNSGRPDLWVLLPCD